MVLLNKMTLVFPSPRRLNLILHNRGINMIKNLYVICGLPTSGKLLLGRYMESTYQIPLYTSVAYSVGEANSLPWIRSENYDQLIFEKQESVDRELFSSTNEKAIVIGWHIQNYVYSVMRGGHPTENMYKTIANVNSRVHIRLLYMSTTPDEMTERMLEIPTDQVKKVSVWYQKWLLELNSLISDLKIEKYIFAAEDPDLLYTRCRFLHNQLGLEESNVTASNY